MLLRFIALVAFGLRFVVKEILKFLQLAVQSVVLGLGFFLHLLDWAAFFAVIVIDSAWLLLAMQKNPKIFLLNA